LKTDFVEDNPRWVGAIVLALGILAGLRGPGHPKSSLAKLVGEYFWVTMTNGCTPPDRSELAHWLKWIDGTSRGLWVRIDVVATQPQGHSS